MSAVTVIANLPCLGLGKGDKVTIELTDLIRGAIDGGKLSLVEPIPAPDPVVDVVETVKPKGGRAGGERADHDAPGGDN